MRRILKALSLAFLALAVVAPAGGAQAPSCSTLDISHVTPPPVEPGGVVDVTVNVENTGQFAEVLVPVRAVTATGWTVEPREQNLTIAPQQTASATFRVTAPSDAVQSAQLQISAQGQCSANGTPFPIPGAMVTNTVTDTVVLDVATPSRFTLPDIGAIPPEYFLGGLGALAIVVGAIVAMRRKSAGFDVKCVEAEKHLRPGRGTSFPIEIRNRAREPDVAQFEVGEVPAGWNAFMALPELTLAGGESRTLWLMVRAPPNATSGSGAVVPVAVRSRSSPKLAARVAVRAEVSDGPTASDGLESTRV